MLQTLTLYSPCLKPYVFIQIFEAENPSANQNANPSSANIRGRNMPLLCNRGKFEQSAEVTISNQIGRTFIARCWYFMGGAESNADVRHCHSFIEAILGGVAIIRWLLNPFKLCGWLQKMVISLSIIFYVLVFERETKTFLLNAGWNSRRPHFLV